MSIYYKLDKLLCACVCEVMFYGQRRSSLQGFTALFYGRMNVSPLNIDTLHHFNLTRKKTLLLPEMKKYQNREKYQSPLCGT